MASRGYSSDRGFGAGEFPWQQLARMAPIMLIILLAIYLSWGCFYTLHAHEKAVVLRFGKYLTTDGPGLHFMVPIVDNPVRVSVEQHIMRLPVPRESDGRTSKAGRGGEEGETLELTGDLNAAVVEWTVLWSVRDPEKYVFSFGDRNTLTGAELQAKMENLIGIISKSVMHRLVGDYSMDEMLTSKREEVGVAALRATQAVLDRYDCGVTIADIQMQRVTPPNEVKPAFDDVNAAIQRRDTRVNEANVERNKLIPRAQAEADKLIREAEGYSARRRAEAQGEIAALLAKYRAYKEAPDITRRRLYLEAMEEVLRSAGPKTVLDADLRGLIPLLQLESEVKPAARTKEGR